MRTGLKAYIEKIKADKVQRRRLVSVLCVLSLFVSCGVFWKLRLIGITMSNDTYCGKIEHTHSEECIGERVLICGFADSEVISDTEFSDTALDDTTSEPENMTESDDTAADCDTDMSEPNTSELETTGDVPAEHIHTDECYKIVYICGMEEHHHSMLCYSNPDADVESAADWEATLPRLTGKYDSDIINIAESQLGYRESELNYRLAEDGETMRGYTRYGEWYGNPHGDWSAMFASFCLQYAGIPDEAAPYNSGADAMYKHWENAGLTETVGYEPRIGDLIFLDLDNNGTVDHVGIVRSEIVDGTFDYVCGDINNAVDTCAASCGGSEIVALGSAGTAYQRGVEAGIIEVKLPSEGGLKRLDDGSYVYEDDEVIMKLYSDALTDDVTLSVVDIREYMEASVYDDLSGLGNESEEYLIAKYITAMRGGEEIDLSMLELTAEVQVKDSVIAPLAASFEGMEIAPEAEAGVELTPLSIVDDDLVEGSSELAPLGGDVPVIRMAVRNGSVMVRAASLADMKFTVQYYAYLDILNRETVTEMAERLERMGWKEGEKYSEGKVYVRSELESGELQKYGYLPIMDTSALVFKYDENGIVKDENGVDVQEKMGLPKNGEFPNDGKNQIVVRGIYIGKKETAELNSKFPDGIALKTTTLTEIYTDKEYNFFQSPNLSYFNSQKNNKNYEIIQIWKFSEDGKKLTGEALEAALKSIDQTYWEIVNVNVSDINQIKFTNRKETADADQNYIYIDDKDVIRLVFNPTVVDSTVTDGPTTVDLDVNFYDYNITDGIDSSGRYITNTNNDETIGTWGSLKRFNTAQGINSNDNYKDKTGVRFGFGNNNTATGLGDLVWYNNGRYNFINAYNRAYYKDNDNSNDNIIANYKGCTFGLASQKLDDYGRIKPVDGIAAPNLFSDVEGESEVIGKKKLYDYKLGFERKGDTHTLKLIKKLNADGNYENVINDLRTFIHPTTDSNTYNTIYTNNFWPLDEINYEGKDPNFGNNKNNIMYVGTREWNTSLKGANYNNIASTLPISDDNTAHNSYFGFDFAVDFELIGEYCGPLQYYFFGDDDMWVYLVELEEQEDGTLKELIDTSMLICDIGGVHSSVGEYVNLWDYIPTDESTNNGYKAGKYRLKFFYTERGASGSTCYMRYTLPSISNVPNDSETGSLDISKLISGNSSGDLSNVEFKFEIEFKDKNGKPLPNLYPSYVHYDGSDEPAVEMGTVGSNGEFSLKAGEHIRILYLPVGTKFTITEIPTPGFGATSTVIKDNGDGTSTKTPFGAVATGKIDRSGETVYVEYTNVTSYELPNTGGRGTIIYTISGIMLMALPFIYGYRLRRKGERRQNE